MAQTPYTLPVEASVSAQARLARRQMAELRQLLADPHLELEIAEIALLREHLSRLENLGRPLTAETLAELLPESILLRAKNDGHLTTSMTPVVVDAIQESIQSDKSRLAGVLFPVIGPAIRRAIAQTLKSIVQTGDAEREYRSLFSIRGLRWRLQALFSRKSFTEILLSNILVFRVEQIFLIHEESGLLLNSVVAPDVLQRDSDSVSAMLNAIQAFVRDSFQSQPDANLSEFEVGDLTVVVERGPQADLAAVVRGNVPPDIRYVFQEALEKIHFEHGRSLEVFNGNAEPFLTSKPTLEQCLVRDYRERNRNSAAALIQKGVRLAVPAALVAILLFFQIRDYVRWNRFTTALDNAPGIVLTQSDRGWFSFWNLDSYEVSGLRDPLAASAAALMSEQNLDPEQLEEKWEAYQALDPVFLLTRVREVLRPPETVTLRISDDGVLLAEGDAPDSWVQTSRERLQGMPGISRLDTSGLQNPDWIRVQNLKSQIESDVILFQDGTTRLMPGQDNNAVQLARRTAELISLATGMERSVAVNIIGRTDSRGSEISNQQLSSARARTIRSLLINNGVSAQMINVMPVGDSEPVRSGDSEEDQAYNRSVSVRIVLN